MVGVQALSPEPAAGGSSLPGFKFPHRAAACEGQEFTQGEQDSFPGPRECLYMSAVHTLLLLWHRAGPWPLPLSLHHHPCGVSMCIGCQAGDSAGSNQTVLMTLGLSFRSL